MNTGMKDWPRAHRGLLLAVITAVLLCCMYSMFRLKPLWNEYVETLREKQETEARIAKFDWPRDLGALEKKRLEFTRLLEKDNGSGMGLEEEARTIIEKSTSLFIPRILGEYGTLKDFMQKASQTEYKDQYDRLDTYFQGKGINIDPVVFGMDELTSSPVKYQMLLKLWTMQAVTDCALAAGLRVKHQRPEGGSRGRMSACLHVCPMVSYYLDSKDAGPYLLEFPVQLELIGNMEKFAAFVDSLYTEGRFLPLEKMEIVTVAPSPNPKHGLRTDSEGRISIDTIAVRVVCSSFFMLEKSRDVKSRVPAASGGHSEKPVGL